MSMVAPQSNRTTMLSRIMGRRIRFQMMLGTEQIGYNNHSRKPDVDNNLTFLINDVWTLSHLLTGYSQILCETQQRRNTYDKNSITVTFPDPKTHHPHDEWMSQPRRRIHNFRELNTTFVSTILMVDHDFLGNTTCNTLLLPCVMQRCEIGLREHKPAGRLKKPITMRTVSIIAYSCNTQIHTCVCVCVCGNVLLLIEVFTTNPQTLKHVWTIMN